MAIKLDMSKTYDRVDWKFLEDMMKRMGFCSRWVEWVMRCISSIMYAFNT